MIRLASFLALFIVASTGPAWLLVIIAVMYSLVYAGIEVIAVAVLVDAFFMHASAQLPLYTIASVGLLCAVELIKPYVLFYNQS